MSGARRHWRFGGSVGRRIRVKSILLFSARKRSHVWGDWLKLEMCKGLVPAVVGLGLTILGLAVPVWLGGLLVGAGLVWMAFVLIQAAPPAFRLNRKHEAYFRAAGLDLSLKTVMTSREAWRMANRDGTLRDFIALRRREAVSQD